MRLLYWGNDGGPKSTVKGFWIIEIKSLFSIVLLRFDKGSRENYHSHAFNAITWWLCGKVTEKFLNGTEKQWYPSIKPKLSSRGLIHKVVGIQTTWALSIRGPWQSTWKEYSLDRKLGITAVTLTHGRKIDQ